MASQTHRLKPSPTYFRAIQSGEKTFEVRRDDRGFQKGDLLHLVEYDPAIIAALALTGRSITKRISYVLTGGQLGIESGYVVLGLVDPDATQGVP
ncbi:hypothetical protein PMI01_00950 [Caulobacter sp. AP07]|uniref:ASCH/PUA domain-containing protein n=1 Tax=Caulobacter sp. AP07 TaxID=1144304 RepID=UPI0002721AD3|nr:ASCH/PUA domain-containing protein [Caulobacter sp. AP07]EJL36575.1 hypothetical protein PMI01_00950 [Caulobacter sp. AP07]